MAYINITGILMKVLNFEIYEMQIKRVIFSSAYNTLGIVYIISYIVLFICFLIYCKMPKSYMLFNV